MLGYPRKGSYIYDVNKKIIKVMNKVEIKKAVKIVQDELTKYGLMTPGKGIDFPVSIMVEQIENDRGRMVPHMVATWNETTIDMFSSRTTGEMSYMIEEQIKCEELDRYFGAELFVNGIIQRSEWIKADHEDCVEYLKENQFGHPALYPQWKKNQN